MTRGTRERGREREKEGYYLPVFYWADVLIVQSHGISAGGKKIIN